MNAFLADPVLGVAADALLDLEKVRVSNENRLRQLTDTGELGHGLSMENQNIRRLSLLVDMVVEAEAQAIKNLQKAMKAHPLYPWVLEHKGVGEKQAARLLAAIRDPYWNELEDRPRKNMSELWAYCGFHVVTPVVTNPPQNQDARAIGVAPKRLRGQKINWSSEARDRTWLIAKSCLKEPGRSLDMPEGSPPAERKYRRVYEAGRIKYAEATHAVDCVRCGPSGKPAQVGSELSDGHKDARATRLVCKEILKDLWILAKGLHENREMSEVTR